MVDHGRLLLVAMDYRFLLITAVYYRLNVNLVCRKCCLVVVLCCVLQMVPNGVFSVSSYLTENIAYYAQLGRKYTVAVILYHIRRMAQITVEYYRLIKIVIVYCRILSIGL